jgi:hypothetical protein
MGKPSKGLRTSAYWASMSKIMKPSDMRGLQRAMLTQLRNGTLHPALRGFVADELELFWFPSPYRERAQHRQRRAYAYQQQIEWFRETKGFSKAKAEARLVAIDKKLKSVAALNQFLKRVRAEARDLRRGGSREPGASR